MSGNKKENLLSNKEFFWITIIVIAILASPYLLSKELFPFTLNDEGLATIGTAFSITAPFIGIGGSILVYIAFKVQYKANQDIRKQFEQQGNDDMFFRIVDDLKNSININSVTTDLTGESKAYTIVKDYNSDISEYYNAIASWMLNKESAHLEQFFVADVDDFFNSGNIYYDISIIKRLNKENSEAEFGINDERLDRTLKEIALRFFFKVPISVRTKAYKFTYDQVSQQHPALIERYFRTLKYILSFLESIRDITQRNLLTAYLVNNISAFEKALIFYYCASHSKEELKDLIIKYQLLSNISTYHKHLYKKPELDKVTEELKLIFAF